MSDDREWMVGNGNSWRVYTSSKEKQIQNFKNHWEKQQSPTGQIKPRNYALDKATNTTMGYMDAFWFRINMDTNQWHQD